MSSELDLVISRLIQAPRASVWTAWSDPHLLQEWWCPKPWRVELECFEMRAGGAFDTVLHGPNGERIAEQGAFLEVVPYQRIAFTTMLTAGWRPTTGHFLPMTAIITLADAGNQTAYDVRVLHPDAATCKRHLEMGFHEGWGICISQLEELAQQLAAPH